MIRLKVSANPRFDSTAWCAIQFCGKTKDLAQTPIFFIKKSTHSTVRYNVCTELLNTPRLPSSVYSVNLVRPPCSNRQLGLWQAVILVSSRMDAVCEYVAAEPAEAAVHGLCVSCIRPVIARCSPNPSALHSTVMQYRLMCCRVECLYCSVVAGSCSHSWFLFYISVSCILHIVANKGYYFTVFIHVANLQ
jgi:hypothetical protein